MNKKTKILVTIGPASQSIDHIEGLMKAGANMFRLNFSHGNHKYHSQTLNNIKKISKKLNKKIGILQDISGPKVRIGDLKETFHLYRDDEIIFMKENIVGYKAKDKIYKVSINYPKLLNKVKKGEFIYMNDGLIRAIVIKTGENIVARVKNHGILSSKKGINFPNTKININVITKKDAIDIQWGINNKVDFFAISFVQNVYDIKQVRNLLKNYKGKLIAKIEKFDAIENIDEILEHSDGIMVARGDLGIEVPYYDVPLIQKTLIKKANIASKPVITATQMLLSMTYNERATRAEISDVANAVIDGTDVVMLSEESAVGENPINVVNTMKNIICKAEEIYDHTKPYEMNYLDKFDVIQATVSRLADDIQAKGILALTSSGQSAIRMSRYRPKTPILAFSHKSNILNYLSILWGVVPVDTIKKGHAAKMFNKMLCSLAAQGILEREGPYVATIGYPVGVPGNTNTIKILNKNEIEYYLNYKK